MGTKPVKKTAAVVSSDEYLERVKIKQLPNCKNVYALRGYKPVKRFCRYVPFMRLKKDVEAKTLTFVSPTCWTDPFEKLYWGRDYDGYNKPSIACLCVTEYDNHHSEDAMWKSFSDGYDKTIRVVYNSEELFRQLDKFAEENSCKIYVSKMDYNTYTRDDLFEWKPLRDYSISPMDDKTLLALMSLKRKAFKYENEVRIFIVNAPIDEQNNLSPITMQYDLALIECVTIAPVRPFLYNDPRQALYPEYQALEHGIYECELKRLIPSVKVSKSVIYQFKKSEKSRK